MLLAAAVAAAGSVLVRAACVGNTPCACVQQHGNDSIASNIVELSLHSELAMGLLVSNYLQENSKALCCLANFGSLRL